MSGLAEAARRRPFSNGTERYSWEGKWCAYCVHDHDITHGENGDQGCDLLVEVDLDDGSDEWRTPEAWLPEPDDGHHFLPSRMVCLHFKACTRDNCTGDPGADERAQRIAEVTTYWKAER